MLADQIAEFSPSSVSVGEEGDVGRLRAILDGRGVAHPEIYHGLEGLDAVASCPHSSTVVTGIVGSVGLQPTMSAIKLGKDIALANKETLISGGPVINPLVKQYGVNMLPADSEHSAVFQSLQVRGCEREWSSLSSVASSQ